MANQAVVVLALSWITFSMATMLVAVRLCIRFFRKTSGIDDYLITAALMTSLVGSIANSFQVANGQGKHMSALSKPQLRKILKWTLVSEVQNGVATTLIKVSICVFLLRLTNRTRRWLRLNINLLIIALIAFNIAVVAVLLSQCRPLKAYYDHRVKGTCFSKHVATGIIYGQAGFAIFTDFFCAALPVFVVQGLQMRKRTKVGLSILMGLGIFTASCAIIRTTVLYRNNLPDVTYTIVLPEVFAILEENLGIVIASVPVLKPLGKLLTKRSLTQWLSYLRSGKGGSKSTKLSSEERISKDRSSAYETTSQKHLILHHTESEASAALDASRRYDLEAYRERKDTRDISLEAVKIGDTAQ